MATENLRKVFNYDNLIESRSVSLRDKKRLFTNTVSAGGCLFYNNKNQLLLIKYADEKWNLLDDLGGKVDESDMTISDTIVREVVEETNGVINAVQIRGLLMNSEGLHFYCKSSKYYLILIEVGDNFYPNTEVFGDSEGHDKIQRTIRWYNFNDVQNVLAQRISHIPELMSLLQWGKAPLDPLGGRLPL